MIRLLLLSTFILAAFPHSNLHAEEAPKAEEKEMVKTNDVDLGKQAIIENNDPEISPGLKKLNKQLKEISLPLNAGNRRHFYMIYNNHNMISTVEHVRSKVSEGIEACSKENPDMEEALRARFAIWDEAVDAKLDEARGFRDNMIEVQEYTKTSKIRNVIKQADKLRKETNESVETIPVTTKEACDYLLNKMDETQETMLSLLSATLITLPQALQKLPPEEHELEPEKPAE